MFITHYERLMSQRLEVIKLFLMNAAIISLQGFNNKLINQKKTNEALVFN